MFRLVRTRIAHRSLLGTVLLTIGLVVLSGCKDTQSLAPLTHVSPPTEPQPIAPGAAAAAPEVANTPPAVPAAKPQVFSGRGAVVNPVPAPAPVGGAQGQTGDVTLNFVDTDVREVLPRVLGDVLHLNFTIDPKVQGTVTIQTSRPLRREDVLPALQEALRASGLTLVGTDGGLYRLVPSDQAARTGTLPVVVGSPASANASPYNVQILPLKFVSATELQHTLEPFLPKGAVMQIDPTRNLLILSGSGIDLSTITDMVRAFDVNWIAGMSFGIVPVQTASPKSIVDQLTQIFGPKGSVPLPGMLSFAPLDHMNAVLVVSPQRAYVDEARQWIDRLDRGENENRPQIYEYHVQNSRAADLAKVLTSLFSSGQVSTVQPQTAPGTAETSVLYPNAAPGSMLGTSSLTAGTGGAAQTPGVTAPGPLPGGTGGLPGASSLGGLSAEAPGAFAGRRNEGTAAPEAGAPAGGAPTGLPLPPVRIVADEKNNTLVIYATPQTYRMIDQALQKIDVVPLQVLIEATIAEVTLGNDLQYGLQYFFHAHENKFIFGATSTPILSAAIPGTFPGFNYILGSTNANVVLNLLSAITNVHVVSAPELLVLDHQSASLLVGNQIPIPTGQIQSTASAGAPLISTIQYVDTGVILKVSPRVNANGLITLDISQEVSAVANATQTVATNSLGPTITQRRIQSTITVQDGETVALGGLIQDNNTLSKTGLPGLSDLPIVGPVFRSTDRSVQRTELLVLLSPRVLHDSADARAATEELRNRLRDLQSTRDTQIP
ncbi:MAG TPA: type II secretion system secretin GspD [Stellaceae bacterium]|nr:type II secretion system secretin GspD [Stellaceae bacterium]